MSFERIKYPLGPLDVIEDAFKPDSTHVPALTIVVVSHTGKIALLRGEQDQALLLPVGSVHRPKPFTSETTKDKVVTTAQTRTNATLGSNAHIMTDLIMLARFANRTLMPVDTPEQKRWPKAEGRVIVPAVVPAIIYGEDPMARHDVVWAEPQEALELLSADYLARRAAPTKSAQDAVMLSMPLIARLQIR
jgi:hypothetical protein